MYPSITEQLREDYYDKEINEFSPLARTVFLLDLDDTAVEINPECPDANSQAIIRALKDTNEKFDISLTVDEFWKKYATTEIDRLVHTCNLTVEQARFFMEQRSLYHSENATRPVARVTEGMKYLNQLGGNVVIWSGNPLGICMKKASSFLDLVTKTESGHPMIYSGDLIYNGDLADYDRYFFKDSLPANKTFLATMVKRDFGPEKRYIAIGDNIADINGADFVGVHLCIRYNPKSGHPPVGLASEFLTTYYWIGDPLMLAASTDLYKGISYEDTIALLAYIDKIGLDKNSRVVDGVDPESRAYKLAYYCIQNAFWPEELKESELETIKLALLHRIFLTVTHKAQEMDDCWSPQLKLLLAKEIPVFKRYLDYMSNLSTYDHETVGKAQVDYASRQKSDKKRKRHRRPRDVSKT